MRSLFHLPAIAHGVRRMVGILALAGIVAAPAAADLIVFAPRAVETAVTRIAADAQAAGGDRIQFVFGTAGSLADRAAAGERADVLIGTTQRLQELEQRGVVAAGARAVLGQVGIGVAVKAGAAKPDVATPAALRQTLLNAASIGYADPAAGGTGGTHFAKVVERLGLADALRSKTKLYPQGTQALEAVARGEIELAVTPTSEIVVRDGLALAGLLPGDLQNWLSYSAAVLSASSSRDGAKAFLLRLTQPDGQKQFAAVGFMPPPKAQ